MNPRKNELDELVLSTAVFFVVGVVAATLVAALGMDIWVALAVVVGCCIGRMTTKIKLNMIGNADPLGLFLLFILTLVVLGWAGIVLALGPQ